MPVTVHDWNTLADASLAGEIISREDARAVLDAPDEALLDQLAAAYRVRRQHFGNRVRLHFLLNAQSGLCPEDCHYCSQSAVSAAEIEKYPFMAREKILAAADRAASLGVPIGITGELRLALRNNEAAGLSPEAKTVPMSGAYFLITPAVPPKVACRRQISS